MFVIVVLLPIKVSQSALATVCWRSLEGHLRDFFFLCLRREQEPHLCRGRPFFMRAALGLGMYWLLAWCSSSLLKYWMVLFKPSSSGTCQHKNRHLKIRGRPPPPSSHWQPIKNLTDAGCHGDDAELTRLEGGFCILKCTRIIFG